MRLTRRGGVRSVFSLLSPFRRPRTASVIMGSSKPRHRRGAAAQPDAASIGHGLISYIYCNITNTKMSRTISDSSPDGVSAVRRSRKSRQTAAPECGGLPYVGFYDCVFREIRSQIGSARPTAKDGRRAVTACPQIMPVKACLQRHARKFTVSERRPRR